MVSKASEDLPEPDSPVITTSLSRGRSSEMFLRLCSRAPRMEINLEVILWAMSEWPRPSARLSPGEGEPQEEGVASWFETRQGRSTMRILGLILRRAVVRGPAVILRCEGQARASKDGRPPHHDASTSSEDGATARSWAARRCRSGPL